MQRLMLALGVVFLAMGNPTSAQQPTVKDVSDAIKVLKNTGNPQDRAAALSVLAYMGEDGKSASKEVVGFMFDNSSFVRGWAATALTKINPDLSVPVLSLVNSKDEDTRMEALQKLVAMGPDVAAASLPAVTKFLSQADPQDRPKVIAAMTRLGVNDPTMAATLANIALKDTDPAVRTAALGALPKLGDVQGALTIFDGLLKNSDPAERSKGVTGLAALAVKYPQAMKTLQSAANDPSPTVSGAAKQAVEKVKKEQKSK